MIGRLSKIGSVHKNGVRYSDLQKHESSCLLLSDRFWCISPEAFELQKIFIPLIASLFKELSDKN